MPHPVSSPEPRRVPILVASGFFPSDAPWLRGRRDDRRRHAAQHQHGLEANYTDSHGQSDIGVGIARLLNFDLLPRIKRINEVQLYRPVASEPDACPRLTPALPRPIQVGWPPDTRRPARPDSAVRVPRSPVRRGQPRHGRQPQSRRGHAAQPPHRRSRVQRPHQQRLEPGPKLIAEGDRQSASSND
ncbi:Tn3 family transposase [Streptomyces sp. NPDC005525]|uniref:Tn3 family transposase n=1 Tax=Streptomyces sp. NPDC005525 TaxID=3364720 RepID=UPI0036B3D6BB